MTAITRALGVVVHGAKSPDVGATLKEMLAAARGDQARIDAAVRSAFGGLSAHAAQTLNGSFTPHNTNVKKA